jgi:hypothetical protein
MEERMKIQTIRNIVNRFDCIDFSDRQELIRLLQEREKAVVVEATWPGHPAGIVAKGTAAERKGEYRGTQSK